MGQGCMVRLFLHLQFVLLVGVSAHQTSVSTQSTSTILTPLTEATTNTTPSNTNHFNHVTLFAFPGGPSHGFVACAIAAELATRGYTVGAMMPRTYLIALELVLLFLHCFSCALTEFCSKVIGLPFLLPPPYLQSLRRCIDVGCGIGVAERQMRSQRELGAVFCRLERRRQRTSRTAGSSCATGGT